jgi:hypothetical protein
MTDVPSEADGTSQKETGPADFGEFVKRVTEQQQQELGKSLSDSGRLSLYRGESYAHRPRRIGPDSAVDRAISESLEETGQAFEGWAFEAVLALAADAVHPGLGRVISIAFKMREAVGDAEALASLESGGDLHVPLLHIAPGIEIELSLHLPGHDGAGAGGPWVSGFALPGDGGLFGGWAIERDEHPGPAEQKGQSTGRPSGQPSGAVISYQLSKTIVETEPIRRAAFLREAASPLLRRLRAVPKYVVYPVIVVYDERAACGMWMIQPELSSMATGWRIEIRYETETGLTTALITSP